MSLEGEVACFLLEENGHIHAVGSDVVWYSSAGKSLGA